MFEFIINDHKSVDTNDTDAVKNRISALGILLRKYDIITLAIGSISLYIITALSIIPDIQALISSSISPHNDQSLHLKMLCLIFPAIYAFNYYVNLSACICNVLRTNLIMNSDAVIPFSDMFIQRSLFLNIFTSDYFMNRCMKSIVGIMFLALYFIFAVCIFLIIPSYSVYLSLEFTSKHVDFATTKTYYAFYILCLLMSLLSLILTAMLIWKSRKVPVTE